MFGIARMCAHIKLGSAWQRSLGGCKNYSRSHIFYCSHFLSTLKHSILSFVEKICAFMCVCVWGGGVDVGGVGMRVNEFKCL